MITVVCCITNKKIFNNFLGKSLKKQNVKFKFISAPTDIPLTSGYNAIMDKIDTEYVAFIHQDILMMDRSWLRKAEKQCNKVKDRLGVAGVAGVSWGNKIMGYILHFWKTSPKDRFSRYYGKKYRGHVYGMPNAIRNQGFTRPWRAMTLDTMVLIVPTEVFKKCPFDPEIPRLMGVDFCLTIKHKLKLDTFVLPLKTWHHPFTWGQAKKRYGYVSPYHIASPKGNRKTNRIIKKKWKGIFNLIFSTCRLDVCPKCKRSPCLCDKPLTIQETINWKKKGMGRKPAKFKGGTPKPRPAPKKPPRKTPKRRYK